MKALKWFVAVVFSVFSSGISLAVETIRVGTGFTEPVFVTYAATNPDRVFVVEKAGAIKILDPSSGLNTLFLRVENVNSDGESGLLGLAFHPDYASNGKFYVDVINAAGDTEIREYSVSSNPNFADPASGRVVLAIDQPNFTNHKAGWIAFGPDKNLYIATGDGGDAFDPFNSAQNTGSLLGKILRINVNPSGTGPGYTIPPGNPFAVSGGAPEVWAYGLRNPYRNSFDRKTGDLFIADVGQFDREEINFEPANSAGGANYGWSMREGRIATPDHGGDLPGATDPIYDYSHGVGSLQGIVVIGGYVYRGTLVPELQGQYVFGDYYLGRVWSFEYDGSPVTSTDVINWTAALEPDQGTLTAMTSFGEDARGELYILNQQGDIFQVVPEPGAMNLLGTGMLVIAAVFIVRKRTGGDGGLA